MSLRPETKAFLKYLQDHPDLRSRIRAAPDKTLLYAGVGFGPMWREIERRKLTEPQYRDKETLPEVLRRTPAPGTPSPNLLGYVQDVERQVPDRPDAYTVWRALSGIFASHASGKVSFQVGGGVTADKVLVATELSVLSRNPNVDPLTHDIIAYYQRCAANKETAMNFGFVAG